MAGVPVFRQGFRFKESRDAQSHSRRTLGIQQSETNILGQRLLEFDLPRFFRVQVYTAAVTALAFIDVQQLLDSAEAFNAILITDVSRLNSIFSHVPSRSAVNIMASISSYLLPNRGSLIGTINSNPTSASTIQHPNVTLSAAS